MGITDYQKRKYQKFLSHALGQHAPYEFIHYGIPVKNQKEDGSIQYPYILTDIEESTPAMRSLETSSLFLSGYSSKLRSFTPVKEETKMAVKKNIPTTVLVKGKKVKYTTCLIRYRSGNVQEYTYKVLASEKLKPGDIVLVPVGEDQNYVLASVTYVFPKPTFPSSYTGKFRWIVQKINLSTFMALTHGQND